MRGKKVEVIVDNVNQGEIIYREDIEKQYIHKDKIRDKIKELEENIKNILKEIEWAKEVKDKAYLKACRDICCRLYGEKQLLEEIIGE